MRAVEVGDGVVGWSTADRVCVLPFAQCGRCAYCLGGSEQVRQEAILNGVGLGTGLAPRRRDGHLAE